MSEFNDGGYADDAGSYDEPTEADAQAGAILPGEDMVPFDIGSSLQSGAQILSRAFGNAFGGQAQPVNFRGLKIGGPKGLVIGSDGDGNAVPSQAPGLLPMPGGGAAHAIWQGIIAKVSAHMGRRVTHATVRYLLNRFGAGAANALGLSEDEVLFIFGFGKKRKGHRRGPGLYTIAKRIRQAERLQHRVRKVLGAQLGRHHAPHAFPFRHRRKRRK